MSSSRADNEKMAGVNSRFAEVAEDDILRMQDKSNSKQYKKSYEIRLKVFRRTQCFYTQFAHMFSVFFPHSLSQSRSPSSADASLLEKQQSFYGSVSKSHPGQLNFH